MHHPKRVLCGSPPGGSSGPAAAASTGVVYGCGQARYYRTRGGRGHAQNSSLQQNRGPRRPPLVKGSIDRSAAASRAPWLCRVGWLEKKWVSASTSAQRVDTAAAARSGSNATLVQLWSRQMQRNASSRSQLTKSMPAWLPRSGSGYFQAYRKSRLPGQMSRRVEKPPACGRFGFGASVLHAASGRCAALALHGASRGLELLLGAEAGSIASTDWYLRALSVALRSVRCTSSTGAKSNTARAAHLSLTERTGPKEL